MLLHIIATDILPVPVSLTDHEFNSTNADPVISFLDSLKPTD